MTPIRCIRASLVAIASFAFALGATAQSTAPVAAPGNSPATTKTAKPTKTTTSSAYKPVVEPQAMAFLKATSDRLAAAKTMSFTAVASYEYPSKLGPPIVYTTRYDVTMQRPDKLRILIPGDGPASEYYYDGNTAIAYAPAENLAAIAEAPPTIDATLEAAFKKAAIFFPFEDLLVADPYKAMTNGA